MTKTIRFLALVAALLPFSVVARSDPPVTGIACSWDSGVLMVSWDRYKFYGVASNYWSDPYAESDIWADKYRVTANPIGDGRLPLDEEEVNDPDTTIEYTGTRHSTDRHRIAVRAELMEPYSHPSDPPLMSGTARMTCPAAGPEEPDPPDTAGFTHVIPWLPNGAKVRAVNPTAEEVTVSWELRDGAGDVLRDGRKTVPAGGTVANLGPDAQRKEGDPSVMAMFLKGGGVVLALKVNVGAWIWMPVLPIHTLTGGSQ